MKIHFRQLQKVLQVGSLLIVLLAAACGGASSDEDDDTGTDPNAEQASASIETVLASETEIDLAGQRLVVMRGGTIEIRDWLGEPVVVGQDIAPATVALLPDQQRAFYAAGTGRYRYYVLDLETLTEQSLMRVSGATAYFAGLSPNQEWVLVNNPPAGSLIARVDGSGESRQVAGFFDIVVWLEDNTLLTLDYEVAPGIFSLPPDTPISVANRYDPATQTTTDVSEEVLATLDVFNNDAFSNNEFVPALGLTEPNLRALALALNEVLPSPIVGTTDLPEAPVLLPVQLTENTDSPILCGEWALLQILPDQTTQTLYSTTDTLFINNPLALSDGSVVFEHWVVEGCKGIVVMAELLQLVPDGSLRIVSTALDPGEGRAYNFFFSDKGPRSAVSPDGRYVAWIGGGLEAGYSTLNLYDVAQNVNIELERFVRESSNFATFHLDTAFSGVAWLPAS